MMSFTSAKTDMAVINYNKYLITQYQIHNYKQVLANITSDLA